MSDANDKAQEVSEDQNVPVQTDLSQPPPQEKHESESDGAAVFLFFVIGLAASLLVGWIVFPKLLYSKKDQPIDFNHALHVGEVDNSCQSCHYFREDGTFSGIPKLENCLQCHEEMMGDSENERVFYEQYVQKQREVPWHVYSKQPPCVFFSHAAHVKMGNMDCTPCHGNHGDTTSLRPYEENRISTYSKDIWGRNISRLGLKSWEKMKMNDCSRCHVMENVNQGSVQTLRGGCFVCHK